MGSPLTRQTSANVPLIRGIKLGSGLFFSMCGTGVTQVIRDVATFLTYESSGPLPLTCSRDLPFFFFATFSLQREILHVSFPFPVPAACRQPDQIFDHPTDRFTLRDDKHSRHRKQVPYSFECVRWQSLRVMG